MYVKTVLVKLSDITITTIYEYCSIHQYIQYIIGYYVDKAMLDNNYTNLRIFNNYTPIDIGNAVDIDTLYDLNKHKDTYTDVGSSIKSVVERAIDELYIRNLTIKSTLNIKATLLNKTILSIVYEIFDEE